MSLYKYVVPARIDILSGAQVRFTQPSALNDPYEMKPNFEAICDPEELKAKLREARTSITDQANEQIVDVILKHAPPGLKREEALTSLSQFTTQYSAEIEHGLTTFLNHLVDTTLELNPVTRKLYYEVLDRQIGVLCLTETATNVLMWSHYSQNHEGFLIEFDETHEFFHQKKFPDDEMGFLRPVTYVTERTSYKTLTELNAIPMFLTKSDHWAYEQEWRMLMALEDADYTIGGDIALFNIPPECITGLIMGGKMHDEVKQAISKYVVTDVRYAHLNLYQATISQTKYEILVSRIDDVF